MNEKIITAPIRTPISLAEAKTHLRLETAFTDDDDYVTALIDIAENYVEHFCNRKLLTQTWEGAFENWEDVEKHFIPGGQLQEIIQITWLDEDGIEDTLDTIEYIVIGEGTDEGRIEFIDGADLSNDLYQVNPIRVRYTCGYYQGEAWVAETEYTAGDQVLANYGLIAQVTATGAGTSHAAVPSWPATIGEEIADATVTWEIIGKAIPNTIRQALFLLVTQYYENREPAASDATKDSVSNILLPHRIWNFRE